MYDNKMETRAKKSRP